MIGKLSIALGATLLVSAAVYPEPAAAYDPCERARQDAREASNDFGRWCDNHIYPVPPRGSIGSCSVSGRGEVLYNRWLDAEARAARACA